MNTNPRTESSRQPIPRPTFSPRRRKVRLVGEVRLPLAGAHRPRARLYRFPDGRLLWYVRLWEIDSPVGHLVGSEQLIAFARINRFPSLEAEVVELVRRALGETAR